MGCGCSKNSVKKTQPVTTPKKGVLSASPNKARVASPVRRIIKRRAR